MTTDNDYIKKLTKDFISESIQDQEPIGLCFHTSILLQVYLATKQIKSSLIKGKAPDIGNDEHYWLQINDSDIIVDATIQQFNNPDPIYVGKLQDNEITKTYVPNGLDLQSWFPSVFANWKRYYEESEYPPALDETPYEKRSTIYILKLATILHEECKKLTQLDEFTKHYYGLYLGPIYCFLYHWQKGIVKFEIKKENMPAGFDNLLEVVLAWGDAEIKKQNETERPNC